MIKAMKLPIQTSIDVRLFAQGYSAMKSSGFPMHSKSEILEFAFNYFIKHEGHKGVMFTETEALDFLSKERLGIKADNKRQKRVIDRFTMQDENFSVVFPDKFDDSRDVTTCQASLDEIARKLAEEIDAKFEASQKQQNKGIIVNESQL